MKLSLQDTFGAVIEADTYERVDLSRAKGFYIAPKVKIQILIFFIMKEKSNLQGIMYNTFQFLPK